MRSEGAAQPCVAVTPTHEALSSAFNADNPVSLLACNSLFDLIDIYDLHSISHWCPGPFTSLNRFQHLRVELTKQEGQNHNHMVSQCNM